MHEELVFLLDTYNRTFLLFEIDDKLYIVGKEIQDLMHLSPALG